MKINQKVIYKFPYPDEEGMTWTIIEIQESQNWCLLMANNGMGAFCPTKTANLSDLKEVESIRLSGIMVNL